MHEDPGQELLAWIETGAYGGGMRLNSPKTEQWKSWLQARGITGKQQAEWAGLGSDAQARKYTRLGKNKARPVSYPMAFCIAAHYLKMENRLPNFAVNNIKKIMDHKYFYTFAMGALIGMNNKYVKEIHNEIKELFSHEYKR